MQNKTNNLSSNIVYSALTNNSALYFLSFVYLRGFDVWFLFRQVLDDDKDIRDTDRHYVLRMLEVPPDLKYEQTKSKKMVSDS